MSQKGFQLYHFMQTNNMLFQSSNLFDRLFDRIHLPCFLYTLFSSYGFILLFFFFESTAYLPSLFTLCFIFVMCFQRQLYFSSSIFTIEMIVTYPACDFCRKIYFTGTTLSKKQPLCSISLVWRDFLEGSQLQAILQTGKPCYFQ